MGKGSIDGSKPRKLATLDPQKPKHAKKAAKPEQAPKAARPAPSAAFQPAGLEAPPKLSLNDVSKDKTAWSSDVGALLKKYGASSDLRFNRPIERMLTQAAVVDQLFTDSANGTSGLVQGLVDKDARRTVFMLEGFLRLYEKELGNKGARALVNVKGLEDNLGNISLHNELLQKATEARLPGTIIDELTEEKDSQKVAYERLVEAQARPGVDGRSPIIAELIRVLVDHQDDMHSYARDRVHTLERLGKMMHKLAENPYDMTQPATGIHELRRDIRWLPIDIEALNGLVVLDDTLNPVEAYQPILQTDLAKSKFVNLPPPTREPTPVHVSKSLYTAMMEAVLKLGEIKDHYEPLALIADLYVKQGLAPNVEAARTLLDPKLDPQHSERDYQQEAGVVYNALRKNDLFGAMAREYDAAATAGDASNYPT